MKTEYKSIYEKNQLMEADIQFLEDALTQKFLNEWINDSKIEYFV